MAPLAVEPKPAVDDPIEKTGAVAKSAVGDSMVDSDSKSAVDDDPIEMTGSSSVQQKIEKIEKNIAEKSAVGDSSVSVGSGYIAEHMMSARPYVAAPNLVEPFENRFKKTV